MLWITLCFSPKGTKRRVGGAFGTEMCAQVTEHLQHGKRLRIPTIASKS